MRAWAVLELPSRPPRTTVPVRSQGGGGGGGGNQSGDGDGQVDIDWTWRRAHGTKQKQKEGKPWKGEYGKCPRCDMFDAGCSII